MKLFKKAFTLAEVLITLTIIGIVASVTLPSLQNNVNRQALEKQTLKVYNTISEAHDRYLANNHIDNINLAFANKDNLTKYFNVVEVEDLDEEKTSSAFANTYEDINGNSLGSLTKLGEKETAHAYKLADGTSLLVKTYSSPVDSSITVRFIVDVNGAKGPNTIGYDAFLIPIIKPAETDMPDIIGVSSNTGNDKLQTICKNSKNDFDAIDVAECCFGLFVRNGFKIDY